VTSTQVALDIDIAAHNRPDENRDFDTTLSGDADGLDDSDDDGGGDNRSQPIDGD
jgi:hypothetical protein